MKRAVIFCNGRRPTKARVLEFINATDTIICANGGSKHAYALGLTPQVVIGDLDSLPQKYHKWLQKIDATIIPHPKDKDFTDSELALSYTTKMGFKEILLFGFIGSRIDHTLANILSLTIFHKDGVSLRIIEKNEEADIVNKLIKIKGKIGERVSLIPLKDNVIGVTTNGLKWELKSEDLLFGKTRGISNVLISQTCTISLKKGIILVVRHRIRIRR